MASSANWWGKGATPLRIFLLKFDGKPKATVYVTKRIRLRLAVKRPGFSVFDGSNILNSVGREANEPLAAPSVS